jgi:diaminopimelate decarboxylase
MDFFNYRDGRLFVEEAGAADIAASAGTPLYVYSKRTIELHIARLKDAFAPIDPLICYSVKANGNLAVLRVCAENGTGFDIVSGGELYRALAAGADAKKIVYAGVGKTDAEINEAIDAGILLFNVESEAELAAIERIAAGRRAKVRVALRANPDVDAHTHEYITTGRTNNKFGVTIEAATALGAKWSQFPHLVLAGVDMHIGSQITETDPYALATDRLLKLRDAFARQGHKIEYFVMGGGFGVFYKGKEAPSAADYAAVMIPRISGTGLKLVIEPGRFIVGNAGILLTRVTYVKHHGGKRFIICDAGMNDLVRPAFYGAYHRIWPIESHLAFSADESDETPPADVVGPICESSDFFAKDRPLPAVAEGQILSIFGAGAYGMSMASNYNARCRAAEVMVDGAGWKIVRRRETYDDLVALEGEIRTSSRGKRG